jgi:hypothetical protein
MNTALQHAARPGDLGSGDMGLRRAKAFAKQMGVDMSQLGSQVSMGHACCARC